MLLLEAFLIDHFCQVGEQLHVSNTYRFDVLHEGLDLLGGHVSEINVELRRLDLLACAVLFSGDLVSLFPRRQFPSGLINLIHLYFYGLVR